MIDVNVGSKHGRLLVLKFSHRDKHKAKHYICRCDCGNVCTVNIAHAKSGHTKSCGCFARERSRDAGKKSKHNKINTRLYSIWAGMKTRCLNPNSDHKKWYYEKGIDICDEWKNDFMSFYNWSMKNGYANDLTIDRVNNNKGYNPENCRWANSTQQSRNKSHTIFVNFNGENKTLKEWSEITKIRYITLYYRYKSGWDAIEIINGRKKVV